MHTVARMATGNSRICEFLYVFGPGASGKDVAMLLILTFFGILGLKIMMDAPENLVLTTGNFARAGRSRASP